jgi:hypothetical protein
MKTLKRDTNKCLCKLPSALHDHHRSNESRQGDIFLDSYDPTIRVLQWFFSLSGRVLIIRCNLCFLGAEEIQKFLLERIPMFTFHQGPILPTLFRP